MPGIVSICVSKVVSKVASISYDRWKNFRGSRVSARGWGGVLSIRLTAFPIGKRGSPQCTNRYFAMYIEIFSI